MTDCLSEDKSVPGVSSWEHLLSNNCYMDLSNYTCFMAVILELLSS